MKGTDVAKFFTGFAANQVLTHGAFAVDGVQFALFGVQYNRALNIAGAAVWGVVLLALPWFAWGQAQNP